MAAAGAFELVTGAVVLALGIAAGWQLPLLGGVVRGRGGAGGRRPARARALVGASGSR